MRISLVKSARRNIFHLIPKVNKQAKDFSKRLIENFDLYHGMDLPASYRPGCPRGLCPVDNLPMSAQNDQCQRKENPRTGLDGLQSSVLACPWTIIADVGTQKALRRN